MRRLVFSGLALLVLALAVTLAACDPADAPDPFDDQSMGVEPAEIRIGSSLALSGHAKYLGIQTLRGALSYLNWVNENGGIHGRRIKVVAYDDAYDPTRCVVNTQRLIIEDKVFALFCYVGTPTTLRILPLVEQAGIPLVGMFTGANALREPVNRHVINFRASYYQETAAAVKHLVEDLGLTRIAVFYQYDAYGFDGLTGAELALRAYNLTPVARGSYIRGTADIDEGLRRIRDSGAQAVVMIGTYEPCAKFISQSRKDGFDPVFYNVSFVGADELARRVADERGAVIILSQVVPPPRTLLAEAASAAPANATDGQAGPDYTRLLARYYPGDTPNVIGLEGYFNAMILVEGLNRAGRHLTRNGFLDAAESISELNLGGGMTVSFSPTDHQGLDKVWFTRLMNGEFRLITDWPSLKDELRRRDVAAAGSGS